MHTTTISRGAIALALTMMLAACGRGITSEPNGAPNLEEWVANVKAKPAPALAPLPVMQQFETFEYAAQGLRDPFSAAFASKDNGSGLRPDSNRRKLPLEAFPLDTLDMVGTIGGGRGMVALVTAPDKVVYKVQPGVYLGQNDGRVTAVYSDRVELVELVPDGAGGWLEKPASIALDDNE